MSNNLENRVITPTGNLSEFLGTNEDMTPLEFTSVLWRRLYQTGSVRNSDGTRARRKRKRTRDAAKRRRAARRNPVSVQ